MGDIAVVRPGDRVPSDGSVIEGQSEVDEAPVTGEFVLVAKSVGDLVYAGSINANGMLRIRLTHTLLTIQSPASFIWLKKRKDRRRRQRVLSIGSAYYTPAVMTVAALIMVGTTARRRSRLVHLDLSRTGDAAHRLPLRACDLDTRGNRLCSCIRSTARASH